MVCVVVAATVCVLFVYAWLRGDDVPRMTLPVLPLRIADTGNASTRRKVVVAVPVTSSLRLRLMLDGAQPARVADLQCGELADFKRARDESRVLSLYASNLKFQVV